MVSSTSTPGAELPSTPQSPGVFQRLARTLSGRYNTTSTSVSSTPVSNVAMANDPLATPASTSTAITTTTEDHQHHHHSRSRKTSLTNRVKRIGARLSRSKSRESTRGGGGDETSSTAVSSAISSPAPPVVSTVPVSGHLRHVTELPDSEGEGGGEKQTPGPIDEPNSLAHKLRSLIDALPPPPPTPLPSTTPLPPNSPPGRRIPLPQPIAKPPKPPKKDKNGRPIQPPIPKPIERDAGLVKLLESATFMNGSRGSDAERPSIWSILDRMRAPEGALPPAMPPGSPPPPPVDLPGGDGNRGQEGSEPVGGEDDGEEGGEDEGEEGPAYSEDSTIMLCSPLIPTKDDLVELADSDFVPYVPHSGDAMTFSAAATAATSSPGGGWGSIWPLRVWGGTPASSKAKAGEVEQMMEIIAGVGGVPPDAPKRKEVVSISAAEIVQQGPKKKGGKKKAGVTKVQTMRVWRPSTTKLSVQAMWWGYRLWVLFILVSPICLSNPPFFSLWATIALATSPHLSCLS